MDYVPVDAGVGNLLVAVSVREDLGHFGQLDDG